MIGDSGFEHTTQARHNIRVIRMKRVATHSGELFERLNKKFVEYFSVGGGII